MVIASLRKNCCKLPEFTRTFSIEASMFKSYGYGANWRPIQVHQASS